MPFDSQGDAFYMGKWLQHTEPTEGPTNVAKSSIEVINWLFLGLFMAVVVVDLKVLHEVHHPFSCTMG